jgi:integrase/recombinase XerD
MEKKEKISYLLEAFFNQRLIGQMDASPQTIASYSITFQLLLKYASKRLKKRPTELLLNHFNAKLVSQFLDDIEQQRGISAQTRNIRLAAIRSFFHYISTRKPEWGGLISEVLAIPNKHKSRKLIDFLTDEEAEVLLNTPDKEAWIGRRDHALLLIALQTGLRLSELTSLKWEDVDFKYIKCIGKGRKSRITPLSEESIKCLHNWSEELNASPSDSIFPTIHGGKMSADSVQYLLKKYVKIAEAKCPSLKSKKISPHVLRHTAAMRLLLKGIDLALIALWLGHESIKTTYIYMNADITIKEEVLKKLPHLKTQTSRFKGDDKIIAFLKSLATAKSITKQ